MSLYQFAPSPDTATREEYFATWIDGFSNEELLKIEQIGDNRFLQNASVGGANKDKDISHIRKSKISWIELSDETQWLYEKLAFIARQLNGQFFEFDLFGFVEHFQYTIYEPDGGHYTWHMDKGFNGSAPRKLSIVLQLSDPSEYEGGGLELMTDSGSPTIMEKKKGLVVAFPSWILHRVTPVTKGIRKTLVIWISGPKFK